ncbi:MAG: malto-oligosyltrehalose trehalohydrolase [bacterium]
MKSQSDKIIGACCHGNGECSFLLWAPFAREVHVDIVHPRERSIPLAGLEKGYWHCTVPDVRPGTRYFYRLDDGPRRPDPASHFQPEGVHGPSVVVDHGAFRWEDHEWQGIPLEAMLIYELHVGTFTPQGTFDAVIERLDDLADLGVNAVEIMPVAQFPGERNWGYDGVYPFAAQHSYGGPEGLRRLVNTCHARGFAVILDVVYNHLGPEGNYTHEFGPYFTGKYNTPWGKAINFDDAWSDEVREFFIRNALHWCEHYHIDALRLDAVHGIFDTGAKHILAELAERVEEFSRAQGREFHLMAESDLNDVRVVRKRNEGGYAIDAQWNDDFHHAVHTLLTGEREGYYADFGKVDHLVKAYREGFVYSWDYSAYRKRHHGSPSGDIPGNRFVAFIQNHDQVGNRMLGERLAQLVSFEALKCAAGILLLSPYIPLLFMGEEYGEESPFLYFIDHSDEALIKAVREGRKREFASFCWKGEPPDPQEQDTFLRSRLCWEKRTQGKHRALRAFYAALIRLRKKSPALSRLDKDALSIRRIEGSNLVQLIRRHEKDHILALVNIEDRETSVRLDSLKGTWKKLLDSTEEQWMGPGVSMPDHIAKGCEITAGPFCFVIYAGET